MSTQEIFALIWVLPLSVATLFAQVFLWQTKEYRWDRVGSYLSGPEGNLFSYRLLSWSLAFIGLAWVFFMAGNIAWAQGLGVTSLIGISLHHFYRINRQGILRPQPTIKAVAILVLSIVVSVKVASIAYVVDYVSFLQAANFLLYLPGIVAASVFIVNIPFYFAKQQVLRKAMFQRGAYNALEAVGITGSFGKTSTKYFLGQLVQDSGRKVAITKDHRNSEVSVAQDMLEQLSSETDLYIAEMGAYKIGEIRRLAELVKPAVGILTTIGNQHLDLFGSQDNIVQAKWELIQSLPAKGTAVLNLDDVWQEEQQKGKKKFAGKVIWYSMKKPADVWAQNVTINAQSITCLLHIKDESHKVTIPLVSQAMLQSVLAASAGAYALGVSTKEIFMKVEKLTPFPQTMVCIPSSTGALVVDDSYSAGEKSAINAIQHIGTFKQKKKIIVIVPIIELHRNGKEVHERLGAELAESNATVIVFGRSYQSNIIRGYTSKHSNNCISFTYTVRELLAKVKNELTADSVILLEGRVPSVLRSPLIT